MKKLSLYITGLLVLFFSITLKAQAVCPICTIAVGAGVGLAEEFGVDDTIIGLWVGGLTVSLIFWTLDWLSRKKINSPWATPLTIVGYFLLVIAPLFFIKIKGYPVIGKEFNKFWGMDKMLLGIALGSLLFWAGAKYYEYLKKKNHGRAYFPYQKVVMPILPLLILSFVFYFITK